MAAEPQKLTRDNTMEATAKEGIKLLEKADPVLAEECKTVLKETAKNGSGDAPEVAENGDDKPKMTRDNTMVATAQEGQEYLDKQGGVNEGAKTRSQEAELNKSLEEEKENEEEKQAPKRPADEEEVVEDVKKQKTENNGDKEDNGDEEKKETPEEEKCAE